MNVANWFLIETCVIYPDLTKTTKELVATKVLKTKEQCLSPWCPLWFLPMQKLYNIKQLG